MGEFDTTEPQAFDPARLKVLPRDQLAEALLDDARDTALIAPEEERERIENAILEACWVPDPEQQAIIDENRAVIDGLFGQMFGIIAYQFEGKDLEPDEAMAMSRHRETGRQLARIGRHKHELETGLEDGEDEDHVPWTEGSTYFHLKEICEAQKEAGMAPETDYVRLRALDSLTDSPASRGIVLLHNALSGDEESYGIGMEALREGAQAGRMHWGEAHEGLDVVMEHIAATTEPAELDALQELAIDVLTRLRGWRSATFGSYAYNYASSVARLAVTFRDLDPAAA